MNVWDVLRTKPGRNHSSGNKPDAVHARCNICGGCIVCAYLHEQNQMHREPRQ